MLLSLFKPRERGVMPRESFSRKRCKEAGKPSTLSGPSGSEKHVKNDRYRGRDHDYANRHDHAAVRFDFPRLNCTVDDVIPPASKGCQQPAETDHNFA